VAIPSQEMSAERALVSWAETEPSEDGPADVAPPVTSATLRIRQIELVGFKSFRDRTLLRFPSRVTGVVGPNGCGKSNVVDAIRWVLGEQSAKRLRGDGMEDVIFGGNDRHAPLGMSQVSIVFETDGLPLDQFALLKEAGHPLTTTGPAEIMVTRRYFRSGESEYLMNGVTCRLRDITELFLGTGLGGKAYAIIEQGRVEALIGAKPEELRLFIEEAAGTTLYRNRRQMAERKMERTRDNLLRVQDILREVERQLATLRRQARRAEQYKALLAEIAVLDMSLSARTRARLLAEIAHLCGQREQLNDRESILAAALDRLEAERRDAREHEVAAQQAVQDAQAAAYEARGAADAGRSELARLEGRAGELEAQDRATAHDLAQAVEQRTLAAAERADADERLAALLVTIEDAEQQLALHESQLLSANEALIAETASLESARVDLVAAVAALADAQNAVGVLQERRNQEETRRERLQAMLRALEEREQAAVLKAETAERAMVEQQARLGVLEGEKRERAENLRGVLFERTTWEQSLDAMKDGAARARSRRDSLREIQESRAGYTEGVRAVLAASSREEALGLVAEILEIPAEHERAVAAALGEQLQAVVMRDHAAAKEAVQALRRAGAGRAMCLPYTATAARIVSTSPAFARPLLDVVRVRPGYEGVARALLGNVLLVEDLDTALAVWNGGECGWSAVTPGGETLAPSGAITGGSERSEETLLAQRRELRTLDDDVARRDDELAAAKSRYEQLTEMVQRSEQALKDVDAELAHVAMSVVAAEKDSQRGRQETHELLEQRRSVAGELSDTTAQLILRGEEAARLDATCRDAADRRREGDRMVEAAERRVAECRAGATALHEEQTSRRIALAEAQARRDALVVAIERLRRLDEETERRATLLADRQRVDRSVLEQTRETHATAAGRIVTLDSVVVDRSAALASAEAALRRLRELTETAERGIAAGQAELDGVRSHRATIDIQMSEHRMALAHLEQTIRERYQRDLSDAQEREAADPADDELQLGRLRERVSHMGEVNVGALTEITELEERQQFLVQQRDDLDRALEDLKKTIGRLNRASRAKFRETFDRVDACFREVLPKLFGGGKAQLQLTDEEQILESGVEVIVQPPGKRVGPLDLLSGGEKALTAVSLIFALFLIKPSPFCFLDEVDAPLDDANIGRFNGMVREMSQHSQFILITHNKRTMEVAETLYGITMEEPGVSKVVSVRLPE
jgi:chromosome segregation protein